MRHPKLAITIVLLALSGYGLWHEFIFPEIHANLCESPAIYTRQKGIGVPGYLSPPKNRQAIIFLHGIRDDGIHAWTSSNGQYWPRLFASEVSAWDVYVAQYPDSISIDEIGKFLKTDLDTVFEDHDRIYIVAHSMGGLVAREFLLANPAYAKKVSGMFFLATPSLGSAIANLLARLNLGNRQSNDLQTMDVNPFLQRQQKSWSDAKFNIKTNCSYEIRRTWFFEVVNRNSAERLCDESRAIDAGHSTIAKPDCADSYQERMLKSFLNQLSPLPPDETTATYVFPGPFVIAREDNAVTFNLTPAVGGVEFAAKRIHLTNVVMTATIASESDEPFGFDVELIPESDELEPSRNSNEYVQMSVVRTYSDRHSLLHFVMKTNKGRDVHSINPLTTVVPLYRRNSEELSVVSVNDGDFDVGERGLRLQLFLWTLWGGRHTVTFQDVTFNLRATVVRKHSFQ